MNISLPTLYDLSETVETYLREELHFKEFSKEVEHYMKYQLWKGEQFRYELKFDRYRAVIQKDLAEALWATKVYRYYNGDGLRTTDFVMEVKARRPTALGRAWDSFWGWV
jgi:hypothetical protein